MLDGAKKGDYSDRSSVSVWKMARGSDVMALDERWLYVSVP